MLQLEPLHFIGNGGERAVYRHPDDSQLCVKVTHRGTSHPRESVDEVRYWQRLDRSGCNFKYMPRFYGWAATNLGAGVCWQLVQSESGAIAPSLTAALVRQRVTPAACRAELARFKEWTLSQAVLTRDLHPKQFVCRFSRSGSFRLVLVDGWGNNEFIPVSTWSRMLNRKKIERRWERFMVEFDALVLRCDARRLASPIANGRLRAA